jgi:hypothetical protein
MKNKNSLLEAEGCSGLDLRWAPRADAAALLWRSAFGLGAGGPMHLGFARCGHADTALRDTPQSVLAQEHSGVSLFSMRMLTKDNLHLSRVLFRLSICSASGFRGIANFAESGNLSTPGHQEGAPQLSVVSVDSSDHNILHCNRFCTFPDGLLQY